MKSILKRIGEFFQNTDKKRLVVIVTLASVILVAAVVGTILLNRVHYAVLYSGLDAGEAGTIKSLLDDRGVKSQVQGTSTILVPEDRADDLRIELASEGYPSTGLNYGIFQGASALGATDLERRTLLQYQLQENIRQTLRHMEKVQDCIVIANLASDSSFVIADNTSEASVAVQLSLKNGQTLTSTEARSIQELVLKSVPNLKPENISIVDSKMNYYDMAADDNGASSVAYTATQQQLTEQMKDILAEQALRVLEPAIGRGNVAVSVNLTLDFDKQTVSSVEFSPPIEGEMNGLARSMQELYNAVGTSTAASGAAGTDTNGSGNPAYVSEDQEETAGGDTSYTKTYNYELNEVQTQIEKAQGTPENLTVAVLLNSSVEDIDGYIDGVKSLVAKAIGVKADYISVEQMPFITDEGMETAFAENQQSIKDLGRTKLITTIVTIVGIMAIVLLIGRFFVRKPARYEEADAYDDEEELPAVGQAVSVTAGDMMDMTPGLGLEIPDLVLKKSSEAEKIEELMDRYPETVAQILRTWLAEDS